MRLILSVFYSFLFNKIIYLGHPSILDINEEVLWTKPEDLKSYRGIFKIFIIPPEDLYLPVIPERINGKLVCYFSENYNYR